MTIVKIKETMVSNGSVPGSVTSIATVWVLISGSFFSTFGRFSFTGPDIRRGISFGFDSRFLSYHGIFVIIFKGLLLQTE